MNFKMGYSDRDPKVWKTSESLTTTNEQELVMAYHDIQNSLHLLKRLERDTNFLLCVLDQAQSYIDQAKIIASELNLTQTEIRYALREKKKWEI